MGILGEVTYGRSRGRVEREPKPKPREKCPIHESDDSDSIDEVMSVHGVMIVIQYMR